MRSYLVNANSSALRMLHRLLVSAMLLVFAVTNPSAVNAEDPVMVEPIVAADRWLEMDLYWFDPLAVEESSRRFWNRYAPLYRGLSGHRGIVLNIGSTVDYVMLFTGDLDQKIPLPTGTGMELDEPVTGALEGDTAARQAAWRARFANPNPGGSKSAYGQWTYAHLADLTRALREEGLRRDVPGFRVGAKVVGVNNTYGETATFAKMHPEAWTRWGEVEDFMDNRAFFDPGNALRGDTARYAAYPDGIPEGTRVHSALGAQWGVLSKTVGLDAVMLRDSLGLPRGFTRYGPWGSALPDSETAERMTNSVSAILRDLKVGNPASLTMMWSTAATATSDWRANGLDLETVARQGNLDIFVDQTWAGAWNEVGVRRQTFWNAPLLGWTYQLAYLLQHAAVLSGTGVRHYFLTETFDAWESWDTIHTAPERLRWGIWAYSHAAVKTSTGVKMPAGAYVSWGNRGAELLGTPDVAFLAENLNAAAVSADATTEVFGGTIVYSRDAMQRQVAQISSDFDVRDRTDEDIGSIIKWPVPISSITRMEWLSRIDTDLILFGATAGVAAEHKKTIEELAGRGQAMTFLGGTNGATDSSLIDLAGVDAAPCRPAVQDRMMRATSGPARPKAVQNIPVQFSAPPPLWCNIAEPASTVYGFTHSVGLVRRKSGALDIGLWDPTPLTDYWYRPLRDLMNGEPAPYVLAAAMLNAQLADSRAVHAPVIDLEQTGTVSVWANGAGAIYVLAGNLEEGLRDDADRSRGISLRIPENWKGRIWRSLWDDRTVKEKAGVLTIDLAPAGSVLLVGIEIH